MQRVAPAQVGAVRKVASHHPEVATGPIILRLAVVHVVIAYQLRSVLVSSTDAQLIY